MARVLFNLAVSAATVAIAAVSALPASAAGLTWTLNNAIFNDGTSVTGSFDYDGSAFTNVNIKVEQGTENYPYYVDWGAVVFSGIWQFPAATYKDDGLAQGGFYGPPFDGSGLYVYEADFGLCCRWIDFDFSTPLSEFSKVADYISGGTASVSFSLYESIHYKSLSAAGVYPTGRYSRPGAYVSTTFPTHYERAPEPSMILGSVAGGVALIALRRKRAKSKQAEL